MWKMQVRDMQTRKMKNSGNIPNFKIINCSKNENYIIIVFQKGGILSWKIMKIMKTMKRK